MAETYKSAGEKQTDHEDMLELLDALRGVSTALRLDECQAWRISGARGHIFSWGDRKSFVLVRVSPATSTERSSKQRWTWDKKRLAFCEVTQDGDDEGCLRLVGLPNAEQAEAIRFVLGIRKRPDYTAEQLQAFRERLEQAIVRSQAADQGPAAGM